MEGLLFWLVIVLIISCGIIVFQIFLARTENKLLGMSLAVISFIYSLIRAFETSASIPYKTDFEVDGNVIASHTNLWGVLIPTIKTFLVWNFLTIILILIYFIVKETNKKKKMINELDIID